MERKFDGQQYRTLQVVKVNEESRSVNISFSSENPVKRWGADEILDHSIGCCDLSRLQNIGVCLFNHDYNKVIGRISDVKIDANRGLATITFDEDEQSDIIWQKVKNGTLRGISVGYTVDDYTYIAEGTKSLDGRFTGECYLVTRWTPLEISVVSVPADASVGIGRSMDYMKDLMSRGEKDKQVDGVIAKYRAKAEKYQRFSNIL